MYSPSMGRFLQTDPIGYADDIDLYTYVGNDPTDLVDHTGEQAEVAMEMEMGAAAGNSQNQAANKKAGVYLWSAIKSGASTYYLLNIAPIVWLAESATGDTPTSPEIKPEDLTGKTADDIKGMAGEKGLVHDKKNPNKFRDPKTGKERVRIDKGHVDPKTGKPYDNPNAAGDHAHGYGPDGKPIVDPVTGDKHFPIKPPNQ